VRLHHVSGSLPWFRLARLATMLAAGTMADACIPGPGGVPLNAPGDVHQLVPPGATVASVQAPGPEQFSWGFVLRSDGSLDSIVSFYAHQLGTVGARVTEPYLDTSSLHPRPGEQDWRFTSVGLSEELYFLVIQDVTGNSAATSVRGPDSIEFDVSPGFRLTAATAPPSPPPDVPPDVRPLPPAVLRRWTATAPYDVIWTSDADVRTLLASYLDRLAVFGAVSVRNPIDGLGDSYSLHVGQGPAERSVTLTPLVGGGTEIEVSWTP
jgi:hypothetical protein